MLSEGRISLHVKTEVSELSSEGAITVGRRSRVPSLKVRRAETTLELPSGGSMVLGGLLQDSVRQSIDGFPGLKDLPVLGTLFRSRDFQRNETELVIIVTPYLVKPVATLGPCAAGRWLRRRQRRHVGLPRHASTASTAPRGNPAPAGSYRGTYGFILRIAACRNGSGET